MCMGFFSGKRKKEQTLSLDYLMLQEKKNALFHLSVCPKTPKESLMLASVKAE